MAQESFGEREALKPTLYGSDDPLQKSFGEKAAFERTVYGSDNPPQVTIVEKTAFKPTVFGSDDQRLPQKPQEPSPYTKFENKEDYPKEGYGGEGYRPQESIGERALSKPTTYGSDEQIPPQEQQEPSPYTKFDNKEDYPKEGYGGEGYGQPQESIGERALSKPTTYGSDEQIPPQELQEPSPYNKFENKGDDLKEGYGGEGYQPQESIGERELSKPTTYGSDEQIPPQELQEPSPYNKFEKKGDDLKEGYGGELGYQPQESIGERAFKPTVFDSDEQKPLDQKLQEPSPYTKLENQGDDLKEGYGGEGYKPQEPLPYTKLENQGDDLKEGYGGEGYKPQEPLPHTKLEKQGDDLKEGYGGEGYQPQEPSPYTKLENKEDDLKDGYGGEGYQPQESIGEREAFKPNVYSSDDQSLPQQKLQEPSPYTNFESEKDYLKEGYGGEGYQPSVAPKEQQPDYYSTGTAAPGEPQSHTTGQDYPKEGYGGEGYQPSPKEQQPDYHSTGTEAPREPQSYSTGEAEVPPREPLYSTGQAEVPPREPQYSASQATAVPPTAVLPRKQQLYSGGQASAVPPLEQQPAKSGTAATVPPREPQLYSAGQASAVPPLEQQPKSRPAAAVQQPQAPLHEEPKPGTSPPKKGLLEKVKEKLSPRS